MKRKDTVPLLFVTIFLVTPFMLSPFDIKPEIVDVSSEIRERFPEDVSVSLTGRFEVMTPRTIGLNRMWNRTYTNSVFDLGYAAVECRDGGYAITGITIQSGYQIPAYDLWILRTDFEGNPLWNASFGGTGWDMGFDIVECPDGGFVVIGYTDLNQMGAKVYLIRTDAWGNFLWNRTYGGDRQEMGYSIIRCRTGGFAILSLIAYKSTRLLRIDEEGNPLWNQTYDITLSQGNKNLIECQTGGFAFTGGSNPYYYSDVQLIRTDVNGNILWNHTYGGAGTYTSRGLVECRDGGFAFVGAIRRVGTHDWDMWLVRTNLLGDLRWNRSYGSLHGEVATSLRQTWSGGFAFTGLIVFPGGLYDIKFMLASPTGEIVLNWTLGSNNHDKVFSIVECHDRGFVIAGGTNDGDTGWNFLLIRLLGDKTQLFVERSTWVGFMFVVPLLTSILIVWPVLRWLKQKQSRRD